jgi:hypothetical protein
LLFQLERHVVVASREELATLGDAFSDAGDVAANVLARLPPEFQREADSVRRASLTLTGQV